MMDYRKLGRTDVEISSYGLGVMTFGGQTDEADAFEQLDMALDAGITFFDTAENYPIPISAATQGNSERVLGKWVAARGVRDKVVVATKVTGPGTPAGDMSHIRGADRKLDRANIRAAVETSLQRLGTDTIDLYQVHWSSRTVTTLGRSRFSHIPDDPAQVPIGETLAALDELVKEGKVRAIGVCNESPWGVAEYLAQARADGQARISSIQNHYSLLDRRFEHGLAEFAMREQVGLVAHSPLAGGTLTGKYGSDFSPEEGSRASHSDAFLARLSPAKRKAIVQYSELARDHGLEPAHLALAFVEQQPFTSTVLMAARTTEQLKSNLAVIGTQLPKDLIKAVNAVHDAHSNPK